PAVGALIERPVCEANNRLRQQTIQPPALLPPRFHFAAVLNLPPANCPPAADRALNERPYSNSRMYLNNMITLDFFHFL
ncbi:MAG: hypothetical protein IJK24_08560, partial [Oscillospiraceae bacterium]|nr:hypothetical protein [Oscillospiraceae bacterium]